MGRHGHHWHLLPEHMVLNFGGIKVPRRKVKQFFLIAGAIMMTADATFSFLHWGVLEQMAAMGGKTGAALSGLAVFLEERIA